MELTAKNVMDVLYACFYDTSEVEKRGKEAVMKEAIKIKGIQNHFGFNPEQVKKHKENIKSMLAQLPDSFHKNSGGGMSFLNACMTKDDIQWGEHMNMEALFCLGEAAGFVKPCMPREVWGMLPGGMPYYVVDLQPNQEDQMKADEITQEQFDNELERLVVENAHSLLLIPGVYEAVSEYFNNEIIYNLTRGESNGTTQISGYC